MQHTYTHIINNFYSFEKMKTKSTCTWILFFLLPLMGTYIIICAQIHVHLKHEIDADPKYS